ncbi:unnamed protein product [Discula destructiva]
MGHAARNCEPGLPFLDHLGHHMRLVDPITYLFYPETANRSREDIDRYFEDNQSILVFRNQVATQLYRPTIYEKADKQIAAANEKYQGSAGYVEAKEAKKAEQIIP